MSTALNDVGSAALVAAGQYPDTKTSSPTGAAIDMLAADGPCFAVQIVGDFTGDALAGRIEQSSDGSSWSAITGATFADVTGGDNVQVISFVRTARYVRYAATLTGSSPSVKIAAVIGEQKKTL